MPRTCKNLSIDPKRHDLKHLNLYAILGVTAATSTYSTERHLSSLFSVRKYLSARNI